VAAAISEGRLPFGAPAATARRIAVARSMLWFRAESSTEWNSISNRCDKDLPFRPFAAKSFRYSDQAATGLAAQKEAPLVNDEPHILMLDSVTALVPGVVGSVVIAGSHGGLYAAAVAAEFGLRGIILNDAGIGLDEAGVAGLALLDTHGLAAAAVSHNSARIGDAADMRTRGIISTVNQTAARLGCRPGDSTQWTAEQMLRAEPASPVRLHLSEARSLLLPGAIPVWGLDSNSLVAASDIGSIVVTGSHGGLLGGMPATAIKFPVRAAIYNDAGGGIDKAGLGRLPALSARGIAAATVAAATARIGEARSTWETGIISALNDVALAAGAQVGEDIPSFVARLLR
jgi:hypothetical protein